MKEYKNKEELILEIEKTAKLFIGEFEGIYEIDKDKTYVQVDRTPSQMIAYQLGWMKLVMSWDKDELLGKEVSMPAVGYKWNTLSGLYESFYREYESYSLIELKSMYVNGVDEFINWVDKFSTDELFGDGKRKWASSTPSKWKVWKWIHINTVAPFKSFRSKIRTWKKLNLK